MNVKSIIPILVASLSLFGEGNSPADIEEPIWKYTVKKPEKGWMNRDYDDSKWKRGYGGFGDASTPGSRVSTPWGTENIWMRRTESLSEIPKQVGLLVFHDEDAEVFINGKKVASFEGYVTEYKVVPMNTEAAKAVKKGENLLAVHCRQTVGGQAIDVHLVDVENVPKLPAPKRLEHPFKSELITEWGAQVNPQNAWREYPRPAMVRDSWTNLNGDWDYAIVSSDSDRPDAFDGRILVPFCVESKLSGVQRLLHDDKALWYRRAFNPEVPEGKRVMLRFEAVDYRADVYVNGAKVGTHVGGSDPFGFDVTDHLKEGEDELLVRVEDATGGYQLRGKQTPNPRGIWYTQVSGIWGTVWTETVPEKHIERLTIRSRLDGTVTVGLQGSAASELASVLVSLDGNVVASGKGKGTVDLQILDPKLWSPDSPTLYDLEIKCASDVVKSYVGIREVGRVKDSSGHWRFTLNGEEIFHWGPLDQGWWPDGLLTPPSDEAMRWDVDYLKAAGFNMIRKHIKVEPRRFYTYCDQVGMLVWQDHVAGGPKPKWTRLQPDPEDADWPDDAHDQFMLELEAMIASLENHPSIVVWVPFNEAWGQHRTMKVGKWTVDRDPSRLVNIASGGNFWPVGHIVDEHRYPHPGFPWELGADGRFDEFVKVMGEFGGHGLPSAGHLWDNSRRNWGYGGLPKDAAEYRERYEESLRLLGELKNKGIAGGVYTQTTDVEGEINGLVSYDRKRIKIPADELKKSHRILFEK